MYDAKMPISNKPKPQPKLLRNRLLMSILAVSLMWATSLKVAVYVVSFFVNVPPFDSVVNSCQSTYRITSEERRRFADCVDVQVDQCNDVLAEASYKETRRVNATEATNGATVDSARQIQSNCSLAYTSLRYSIEAWVDAGHTVPYRHSDNSSSASACTAEDLNQLTSSLGDISAVRMEAFSVSSQYSDESQSTVRRLVDYAQLRAAYDEEYIGNHTLRIKSQLVDFANGIEVPTLNVEELFNDIEADVERLVSCISPRSTDEGGECPSFRGVQERLAIIQSEMERRLEIYRKEIDSWRTKVDKYKSNVQRAYEISVRFYWGVKNAIPDWVERMGNSDWWDIDVEDIIPRGVAFPGSTPTFTELPTLDDVWDSVSVSLDLFSTQLDSAEAKAVQLAKDLGNEFELDMILKLPNVNPADYNPPRYKESGSEMLASSLDEEEARHAEKSQVFMERTAVALDAFSELSQSESREEILGDASSFFNITSIQTKLSNVDISFKSLIRPGIDFDVWFLRLNSFGGVLFLFDLLYRIYSTVRVVYKYWIAGDLILPEVDMRVAASRSSGGKLTSSVAVAAAPPNASNVKKKIFGTAPIRLLVTILIHPAVGLAIFLFSMWWVISIAVSLYSPLYQEYVAGCALVKESSNNGTFLTSNLLSLSYNHAYQDGSTKLLEGLDRFDADRGEICASRYAPSASRYQNDITIFASLFDTHNTTAAKMDLMKRCIDVDALDAAFHDTCCDNLVEGSSYSSSCPSHHDSLLVEGDTKRSAVNSTCPMNELVQPPAPFLPPSEYISASSCNVDMEPEKDDVEDVLSTSSWGINDSVFHCDAMPYCDITCKGPNQELLGQTTRECGCTVEWFLHSLWLKIALSLMVYGMTNASRIGFIDGLSRLLWHRLHPDHFTVLSSCNKEGAFITKQQEQQHSKAVPNERNEEAAALIRYEIGRNMLRFQAKGLAMVVCAVFTNIAWICALRWVDSSSTPGWLVD
jgi:hypothetical protein